MRASPKLRVVFMGTPDFAVPTLLSIIAAGHDVVAVYTKVPAPKGRGRQVQKSPVHLVAGEHNIPVYTPLSLKKSPEAQAEFAALNPDVAIVAAYGLILPLAVLSAPKHGCINVHASLLPRWRGASPIHHAILHGDEFAGVTIMQMEEGLDTGPMIVSDRIKVQELMTTPVLHDALSNIGAHLTVAVLEDLAAGADVPRIRQPETGVTYAPMLKKENAMIDWQQSADHVARHVRAFDPWPGTTARLSNGETIKVLSVSALDEIQNGIPGTVVSRDGRVICYAGTVLKIEQVQTANGKRMSLTDLINGGYMAVGDLFQ